MLNVFLTLAAIACVGSSLHRLLLDLDIDSTRRQCGTLVLNVLLPALNVRGESMGRRSAAPRMAGSARNADRTFGMCR